MLLFYGDLQVRVPVPVNAAETVAEGYFILPVQDTLVISGFSPQAWAKEYPALPV